MNIPKSYEALSADLASEKIISKTLHGQKESYMMIADGRKLDLDTLQQRLTVAEHDLTSKAMRTRMLDSLLRELVESLPAGHLQHELRFKILAALKPAEEGGVGSELLPHG